MTGYERIAFVCGHGTGAIVLTVWPKSVAAAVAGSVAVAIFSAYLWARGRSRK